MSDYSTRGPRLEAHDSSGHESVHSRAFVYIFNSIIYKASNHLCAGERGACVGLRHRHRGGVKQRTHNARRVVVCATRAVSLTYTLACSHSGVPPYASNKTRGDDFRIERLRRSCFRIARACAHGFPGDSTLEPCQRQPDRVDPAGKPLAGTPLAGRLALRGSRARVASVARTAWVVSLGLATACWSIRASRSPGCRM